MRRDLSSITRVVIHHTGTPNGEWVTAEDVDGWHRARGIQRDAAAVRRLNAGLVAIGYHVLVYTNGAWVTGRSLDEVGRHTANFNQRSVAICLVGTDRFTTDQWVELRDGMIWLAKKLTGVKVAGARSALTEFARKDIQICGHRDLPNSGPDCPGFDVATWLRNEMEPLAAWVQPTEKVA